MVAFVPVAFFALALLPVEASQEDQQKKSWRERRSERKEVENAAKAEKREQKDQERQERKNRAKSEDEPGQDDPPSRREQGLERVDQTLKIAGLALDAVDTVNRVKDLSKSGGSKPESGDPVVTEPCTAKKTEECNASKPSHATSSECKENAESTTTCTNSCEGAWRGDDCELTCVDETDSLLKCLTDFKGGSFFGWDEKYDSCDKLKEYREDSCTHYPEVGHCCSFTCNEEVCTANDDETNQAPSSRSLSIFTLVALSIV